MAIGRRVVLKALAATGVGAVTATGAYGFLYERHELEVTRTDVPVVGLPPALAGLRIGLLTDVHRSQWVSHDDVTHAVAMLMNERPDLIVLGGDYVTWGDRQYVHPSADALAPLSAPHGVYGILGNHDDDHDMPAALAARGVQMLKDARTAIRIKGHVIDLIGVRFWTKRESDIATLMRGATGLVPARTRSAPTCRGGGPENPARAVRPYARRPGRAAGPRRDRRPEVSGDRRHRPSRRRCSSAGAWERSTSRSE